MATMDVRATLAALDMYDEDTLRQVCTMAAALVAFRTGVTAAEMLTEAADAAPPWDEMHASLDLFFRRAKVRLN
jgi:hypothetical protein